MFTKIEALDGFKKGLRAQKKSVEGIVEAIRLVKKMESSLVCRLDETEVFSEKYGGIRSELFKTGRVASVLSMEPYTYILLSPKDKVDNILYMMYKNPYGSEGVPRAMKFFFS